MPDPAARALDVTLATERGLTRFEGPVEVVSVAPAARRADVVAAFERVDGALLSGYSIAGYATYELGALLCEVPFQAPEGPLLAVGLYEGARRLRPLVAQPRRPPCPPALLAPPVALVSRAAYEDAVAAVGRLLYDGELYQANLTVPFATTFAGDPEGLFAALAPRAKAPYAALVRHGARAFVSLSPELFLAFDGERVTAKPMKGTAPADAPQGLGAEKNRAEHLMIVDLVRNDLGRVCTSVNADALFAVERYPTFATMTSTVSGRLRSGSRLADIFAATFPCGSITGAPKLAAMHALARLEGRPRGIAMGTIGYLAPGRRGWWNVAIRTLAIDAETERAEVRIGGGIVADSNPRDEWAEIMVKRRVFADAAAPLALLETLRVADGAAELEPHLARMLASAEAFGFAVEPAALGRAAGELVAAIPPGAPVLLRLTLACDGTLTGETRPLAPFGNDPLVCLAPARLRSTDPLLRHKTTRRQVYEGALAYARARGCVDGLFLNERDELADGARSTPFIRAGTRWLTPPLGAGAVAGVLRAGLLASGKAFEQTVHRRDLEAAEELAIGNAARGFVRVRLIEPQPPGSG